MYGVGVMAFITLLSNLVAVPVLPELAAELGVDGLLSLVAFFAAMVLIRDSARVKSEHSLSIFLGLRSIFADRRVYLYLLMGISGMFSFSILYSFVATKSQFVGLDAWQIGSILSAGALIFTLVSYLVGTLSDRFGRRMFVIGAQGLIVVSGIGLTLSHGFVGMLVWYVLFCAAETTTYLLSFVYASEAFDPEYVGTSMGVFDSLMDLSLFIGPLLAVLTFSVGNQFAPVFILAVVPAFVAFFATAFWLPRRGRLI
jgi:MFS family permease